MDINKNPRSGRGQDTIVIEKPRDDTTGDHRLKGREAAATEAVSYSCGRDKYDAYPEQRTAASFSEFAKAVLSDRSRAKGKAWFSAPFAQNGDGRHHRCREGALACRVLALDQDGGTREGSSLLGLMLSGYSGFGYTTSSHTSESPHARHVIELSRPVSREERIRLGYALQRLVEARLGPDAAKLDPPASTNPSSPSTARSLAPR